MQLQEPEWRCCQRSADPQGSGWLFQCGSREGLSKSELQGCPQAMPGYSTRSSAQAGRLFRVLSVQYPMPWDCSLSLFPPHPFLQQRGRRSTLASLCLGRSGSLLCLTKGFNFHCLSFVSLLMQIDFPSLIDANLIVRESAKSN